MYGRHLSIHGRGAIFNFTKALRSGHLATNVPHVTYEVQTGPFMIKVRVKPYFLKVLLDIIYFYASFFETIK